MELWLIGLEKLGFMKGINNAMQDCSYISLKMEHINEDDTKGKSVHAEITEDEYNAIYQYLMRDNSTDSITVKQNESKININNFIKWLNEMIMQEKRMIDNFVVTQQYELAYACKESIYTYEFILERIAEKDEDWIECN